MNKSPLFLFLGAAVGFVAGYIVSAKITKKKYETLADRARLVAPYHAEKLLLFSLSDFSGWLKDRSARDSSLELISLKDLYRRIA